MNRNLLCAFALCNLLLQSTTNYQLSNSLTKPKNTGGEIIEPNSPNIPPPNNVEGSYTSFENAFSMKSYFENLDIYFARNYFGTCSYTALTILLSYYDSFYNPIFIPDSFSGPASQVSFDGETWSISTSPGIKYSSSSYGFKNDAGDEDDDPNGYIDYTKNDLFDSNLIYFNDYTLSLLTTEYQDLLDNYYGDGKLNIVSKYSNPYNVFLSNTRYNQEVIDIIQSGTPVILNICNQLGIYETDYDKFHAVVAYAYENNEILCHFGWSDSSIGIPYNDVQYGYVEIYGYAYIDLPNSYYGHTHTGRYTYNNLSYCGCGHHSHIFEATPFSTSYHKLYCNCGETLYEEHTGIICSVCSNVTITPGGPILG